MDLKTPISGVLGIGPSFIRKLQSLNIFTVEDLITYFPFRYDDFTNLTSTLEMKLGERVTLQGEIWSIKNVYTRSRKIMTQAVFNDGSSAIELTWFNQSWLTKSIRPGDRLQISGKVTKYKNKFSIVSPVWEKMGSHQSSARQPARQVISHQAVHTGRMVPIYPETFGLTSKWIRAKIAQILPKAGDQIVDPLPEAIKGGMLELGEAIQKIHFPENWGEANAARERLGFDELFFVQLATLKTRNSWQQKQVIKPLKIDGKKTEKFLKSLPFELTNAQKKVVAEILDDLGNEYPMNRLVQGEVGSGKTVVACVVIYLVYTNGLGSYLMAPTEILAFQHHKTMSRLLEPFGIKVGIYTGSKKNIKDCKVIVGTHALISKKLELEDIGLVIVDEQQRFGVEQRTVLRGKSKVPHFLTMTATPIPRTVALTLYGDLDLSVIGELPANRKAVKTYVVPAKKRGDAYGFIEKNVKEGGQVYIVTPLIEESESIKSVRAAKTEFETLAKKIFPDLRLGLLHGRLKPKEKAEVLDKYKDGEIDILVSTSVVEVGVDVPNATIIVIEGAERFGLAQLHQLRGRVGRGEKQSYCLLFPSADIAENVSRLKNLEKTNDGMRLAELDLKIRGGGDIFSTRQSGRFELKIGDLFDVDALEKSREAARKILQDNPELDKYPLLQRKLDDLVREVNPD